MQKLRDRPSDGIGFMDSVLMVVSVIVGLCVLLAAMWVFGLFHYGAKQDFEPEVTAKIERAAREKKELTPQQYLSLPIRADATVTQSGSGEPPRTRFYVRSK